MDLESNVQARKDANAVIEVIEKMLTSTDKKRQRSLEIIQRWIQGQRGIDIKAVKDELCLPMSEIEANEFEQQTLGFGRYAKMPIGDVPLTHLERLCDEPDYRIPIKRYLLSRKADFRYRQASY